MVVKSCATISARDETSSLRNIRFKACFTEFVVIQSSLPISALVFPKATNSAICNSRGVKRAVLSGWCGDFTVAAQTESIHLFAVESASAILLQFVIEQSREIKAARNLSPSTKCTRSRTRLNEISVLS